MQTNTMLTLGLIALGALPGSSALGQTREAGATESPLVGRVVDAGDGSPVAGAEVLLLPLDDDATEGPVRASGGGGAERPLASVVTGAAGRYRFEAVPAGSFRLRVSRLGYRSVTVQVRTGDAERSSVSVALEVEPIALEPVDVVARGEVVVEDASGFSLALGRVPAERLRQNRHLASDARIVAAPDLREAATLGEEDLLRAMQRLPGVSTRDDYSAELWTRGASWGETRVYLDGLPLFNPVHGLGLFSGVSHRGVASALFEPGARPARVPESSAAVLDLTSSSGAGTTSWSGGADLTLASLHGWARGPLRDGEGGWSLTGRRSWADLAASGVGGRDGELPYAFSDVLGRLDLPLGGGSISASGLVELDELRGEIPDFLHGTRARWGNVAGQVAWTRPLGSLRARQRVGVTTYHARVRTIPSEHDDDFNAPSEPPADHDLVFATVAGELAPTDDAWRLGYDLVHQAAAYEGPQAWPYSRRPPDLPDVSDEATLTRMGIWGRTRRPIGEAVEVEGSLRVDAGSPTAGSRIELQPSLQVRLRVAPGATLSAGAGRYVQYAQSPAPMGPRIERTLESGRLWMLADELRAPLRAELATVGGEVWLGEAWLLSTTAYARRSTGVLLPEATDGLLVQRPPLVAGRVDARGFELGVRRLAGRVTGSAGYSYGRARAEALGVRFPAPTDRRHALDVTAYTRLARWMSVGLAYTHATGAPYARTLTRCVGTELDCREAAYLDRPFLRRSPSYASLDLVMDWTRRFETWSLGFFLQGRNLLGRANDVTYTHSEERCPGSFEDPREGRCADGSAPSVVDRFTTGMPTLPLIGFRIVF